jgi:hypothetical protein
MTRRDSRRGLHVDRVVYEGEAGCYGGEREENLHEERSPLRDSTVDWFDNVLARITGKTGI